MAIKNRAYRQDDERALSEVIGFIMLLGVLVAAMALWMLYVIPVEGREDEITQMNAVRDDFTNYKISLDSLWVNNQSGVMLSTSFNLGTGGGNTDAGGLFLPLMNPIASSATIMVKDNGDNWNITSSSGNYTIPMNILEYQSQNNYWINQWYYYQTGGVFLSQDNGSVNNGTVNRVSPSLTITKVKNNTGTNGINFTYINLVPIELIGGSSIGGNGPVRVDSGMRTIDRTIAYQENRWINISVNVTDKPTAQMWATLFTETLVRGGMTENPSWYKVDVVPNAVVPRYNARLHIFGLYGDGGNPDIYLTMPRVGYVVTLNNIATGI